MPIQYTQEGSSDQINHAITSSTIANAKQPSPEIVYNAEDDNKYVFEEKLKSSEQDLTEIPCDKCGRNIPFNEYKDHQSTHISNQFVPEIPCICGDNLSYQVSLMPMYVCDHCYGHCKGPFFHCPQGRNSYHRQGFDLCLGCGKKKLLIPAELKDPITNVCDIQK